MEKEKENLSITHKFPPGRVGEGEGAVSRDCMHSKAGRSVGMNEESFMWTSGI